MVSFCLSGFGTVGDARGAIDKSGLRSHHTTTDGNMTGAVGQHHRHPGVSACVADPGGSASVADPGFSAFVADPGFPNGRSDKLVTHVNPPDWENFHAQTHRPNPTAT